MVVVLVLLCKPYVVPVFDDADHAGNIVTCRWHIGVKIRVKSNTYRPKFMGVRTPRELIAALKIKWKMHWVPSLEPEKFSYDNNGAAKKSTY